MHRAFAKSAHMIGLLGLFATAAVAASPALAQEQRILRVIPHADLTGIDPSTSSLIMRMHTLMVYETLFALDKQMQPHPMMIDSYQVSEDKLTYTFALRPGLTFHDGSEVTTADVIPSLQRWMVRDAIGQRLAKVTESLTASDDLTLVLKLKQAYGFVEYSLAASGPLTPVIMRSEDVPVDPMAPITVAVGSGPFRFVAEEWQTGNQAVYERFANYIPRSEAPDGLSGSREVKVDRLEFIIVPDANTAAAALAAGEVDFWDSPSLDLLPVLEGNSDIVVGVKTNLQGVAYLRPNHLLPPFNDVRVRQALALSMDQTEFLSAVAGDPSLSQECYSYLICGSAYGVEDGETLRLNREKAKELLAEAGYSGEPVVLLGSPTLPIVNGVAQVAAASMRAVGFNVDLKMMDWGVFVQQIGNKAPTADGGYNVFASYSTGPLFSSPLTNVAINAVCDGSNFAGWFCDDETEALRNAFFASTDEASRMKAAVDLQMRLTEVVPYALAGQISQPHAWRSNVTGVLDSNVLVFWNVEKQ